MIDSTLQRVWDSREAISRRCAFDSLKLVQYYQARQKMDNQKIVNHQLINHHEKTNGFVGNQQDMEVSD
jgi:hypothetical protein